jgi:mono/diheme cytochrome c family protein
VYARLREANLEESLCAQLAEANAARWFKDELSEEEIKALNAYLRNRAE